MAYESFTGAAGTTISGTSGGLGWTTAWSSAFASRVNFVNQSLNYSAGQVAISGGNSALEISGPAGNGGDLVANREFANQSGTIYFSFLFRTSTSAGLSNDFAQFGLDSANVNPHVSVGHTSTGANDTTNTEFFARSDTSSSNFTGVDTVANQTYFLVARVTKGTTYNQVDLYVNPTTITEPVLASASIMGNSTLTGLDTFVLRMARLEPADRYLIDELRITTSYAEAIGLPEPASLTMFALGAAGLAAWGWRRRGRTT